MLPVKALMRYRFVELQYTLEGLSRSHAPLVAYDGRAFSVAGFADDPGLYLVVPQIAKLLHVGPLAAAYILVYGLSALALVVGALGLIRYTGKKVSAIPLVVLAAMMLRFGDLYVFTAIPVITLVPWFLHRLENHRPLGAFMAFSGLVIGASHVLRSFAGISVLFFMGAVLIQKRRVPHALLLIGCAVICAVIPLQGVKFAESRRDAFLNSQHVTIATFGRHPFWHQIYIGMSFVGNPYVSGAYDDDIGIHRASQVVPGIVQYSPEYEAVLRGEVWRLVKTAPGVIAGIQFVKLCVLFVFVLVFANVGLLYRTGYDRAFLAAVGFESLFGFLTVPHPKYLLGMIAFSTIYASLGWTRIMERHIGDIPLRETSFAAILDVGEPTAVSL